MSDKHLSSQFDSELTSVSTRVMEMGGLVESQIRSAVYALAQFSLPAVMQVMEGEPRVNAMEVEIDHDLSSIIARRQPTARDLRLLIAISKTTANLERVGDEAARWSATVPAAIGADLSRIERRSTVSSFVGLVGLAGLAGLPGLAGLTGLTAWRPTANDAVLFAVAGIECGLHQRQQRLRPRAVVGAPVADVNVQRHGTQFRPGVHRQMRLGQQHHAGHAARRRKAVEQRTHRPQPGSLDRLQAQRAQRVGVGHGGMPGGVGRTTAQISREVQSLHGADDTKPLSARLPRHRRPPRIGVFATA